MAVQNKMVISHYRQVVQVLQGGEVEHLGCSHVSKQIYLVTLQTTDGAQQIDNESMVGLGFGVDFATLDLTGG